MPPEERLRTPFLIDTHTSNTLKEKPVSLWSSAIRRTGKAEIRVHAPSTLNHAIE
jgi:hypothetical protein